MSAGACRWCRADDYRRGRCPRCGEPAEVGERWQPPAAGDVLDLHLRVLRPLARSSVAELEALCSLASAPVLRTRAAAEALAALVDAPDEATRRRVLAWIERADPRLAEEARAFERGRAAGERPHEAAA